MADLNERDDAMADVRASIAQLQKGADELPSDAPPPSQESSASSTEGDAEAVIDEIAEQQAPARARDPKTGKFVAASEAPEQPVKPQVKATPEAKEATPPAPSTAPAVGKPPPGWSAEAKATWATLPPALQQAVLKREQEVSDGFRQKSDEMRRFQELEGVIAPRRSYYQRFGFKSDAEAVNHLMTLSDSMERNPGATIAHLAQHYGVDLRTLTGGQVQQNPQLQQPQQQQQPDIARTVQEQVEMTFARMTVQEFEADPPEHYQEVKPLMQKLLQMGEATDLKDAYDKAVWMRPDLRQQVLDSQKAAEEAKRVQAQQAAAAKKKVAANASLNGAPHGTPVTQRSTAQKGSFGEVTDDVRAAIAQLS